MRLDIAMTNLLSVTIVFAYTAFAQEPLGRLTADPQKTVLLVEGTEVRLRFGEHVSSRTASIGDSVPFILDENLIVDLETVARFGAAAVGTVSSCRKAEMLGQGGELSVRVEYIRVGAKRVRVTGKRGAVGQDKAGTSILLTVLFGPLGLMKHGKDVEIRKGTPIVVHVMDSVPVSPDH